MCLLYVGCAETPTDFFCECEGLDPWSRSHFDCLPYKSVEWTSLELTSLILFIDRTLEERELFGELAENQWKSRNLIMALRNA